MPATARSGPVGTTRALRCSGNARILFRSGRNAVAVLFRRGLFDFQKNVGEVALVAKPALCGNPGHRVIGRPEKLARPFDPRLAHQLRERPPRAFLEKPGQMRWGDPGFARHLRPRQRSGGFPGGFRASAFRDSISWFARSWIAWIFSSADADMIILELLVYRWG